MKEIIRAVIVAITFVAIVFALALWSISNEMVSNFFEALGAIAVSALITTCLSIFVGWISRSDAEEKSGDNSVDEKAS